MNSSGNAPLPLGPTTHQRMARASSATSGSTSADDNTQTPSEAPWVGPVTKKNKTPKATKGTHVTPPKGGATAVFPPTQLTPHASNPLDMGTNAEPPDEGHPPLRELIPQSSFRIPPKTWGQVWKQLSSLTSPPRNWRLPPPLRESKMNS